MSKDTDHSIKEYPGTWYTYQDVFRYKLMRYNFSCFPCSLHIILANLPYGCPADGSKIEESWNDIKEEKDKKEEKAKEEKEGKEGKAEEEKSSKGLARSAPKVADLQDYMSQTQETRTCNYIKLFTQLKDFQTLADAQAAAKEIKQFMIKPGPAGMIAGADHAQVFFHTADNRFFYYNLVPHKQNVRCHEIKFTGITAAGSKGKNAIMLDFDFEFEGKTTADGIAATCVMLIR